MLDIGCDAHARHAHLVSLELPHTRATHVVLGNVSPQFASLCLLGDKI